MKKLVLLALAIICLGSFSFAAVGLGVKLGVGENDPKTMDEMFDASLNATFSESPGIFGLEAFYEQGDKNKLGAKIGLDFYGENKLEIRSYGDVTETTYALPLTIYYKYDPGIKEISFNAGAGVTFIDSEVDDSGDTLSESKLFPHITAGAEYRFSEVFGLGLDIKYNFSAKVEKNDAVLSDRSGLSGALAARFYFN